LEKKHKSIPKGTELVVGEKDSILDTALILYGFDEIGLFDGDFKNPVYGFLNNEEESN
jgi:hypothetical protein